MSTNSSSGGPSNTFPILAGIVALCAVAVAVVAFVLWSQGAEEAAIIVGVVTVLIVPTVNSLLSTMQAAKTSNTVTQVQEQTNGLSAKVERALTLAEVSVQKSGAVTPTTAEIHVISPTGPPGPRGPGG